MDHNLRHLRVFLETASTKSISEAAKLSHLSQPAVSHAIKKLEADIGGALMVRSPVGVFATDLGRLFQRRVERAVAGLDAVLDTLGPRMRTTVTFSQLRAFVALRDAESYTLAASRLGIAQPTVHRAVGQLEREAKRPLLRRSAIGVTATAAGMRLADAARLTFAELAQADMDVAEALGREAGQILVGAMPLSRSYVLPKAISAFRASGRTLPIRVIDGPYPELLGGLRRGDIDFLVGALRNPVPVDDVEQQKLFEDNLVFVARPEHPLARRRNLSLGELTGYPFVVAAPGTPSRDRFDELFAEAGLAQPEPATESTSLMLMRGLLLESELIGCISDLQVKTEIELGLLAKLHIDRPVRPRDIGITTRRDWLPTRAQTELVEQIANAVST